MTEIIPLLLFAAAIGAIALGAVVLKRSIQRAGKKVKDSVVTDEPAPSGGYSFPLGIPLFVYPLLLYMAYRGMDEWWSWLLHAAFFGLAGIFLWMALGRSAYEKIHATRPELSRTTWVLNYLLFFVILPVIVWVFYFVHYWL